MALQRNPKTGLLEIVGNRPNSPVQLPQATQPPPQTGGGLLYRLGRGAVGLASDIVQAPFKAAAALGSTFTEDVPYLYRRLQGQTGIQPQTSALGRYAFGSAPVNSKERAGAYGMAALNTAMFGLPVAGAIQTTAAKTAAKEAAVLAAKSAASEKAAAVAAGRGTQYALGQLGKQVVKHLPQDIGYGAGFGLMGGLEQGHKGGRLVGDVLGGTAIGVAAPVALAGGFRGASALAGLAGKGIADALDSKIGSISAKLEAAKSEAAASHYEPSTRLTDSIASMQKNLDRAQRLRNLPTNFAQAWTDRNAQLNPLSKRVGTDLSAYARDQEAIAEQLPKVVAQDYLDIKKSAWNQDMLQKFSDLMDQRDRLLLGTKVEGGRTLQQVEEAIAEEKARAGADFPKLMADYAKIRAWHANNLKFSVDMGMIDQATADRFVRDHPNYSANQMADFLDANSPFAKGGATGTTSGYKAMKGSERERVNSDVANLNRITAQIKNAIAAETKRTIAQKADEAGLGTFGTIWSKEDELARRKALTELSANAEARKAAESAKKSATAALKSERAAAKTLEGRAGEVRRGAGILGTMEGQISERAGTLADAGTQDALSKLETAVAKREAGYAPGNFMPEGKPNAKARALFRDATEAVNSARQTLESTNQISREMLAVARKPMEALASATTRLGKLEARLAEKTLSVASRKEAVAEYRNVIKALRASTSEIRDAMPKMSDTAVKAVDLAKEGLGTWKYMDGGVQVVRTAPKAVADAMNGLGNPQAKAVGDFLDNNFLAKFFLKGPANVTKALATTWNVPFALMGNPTRDMQTVWVNAGTPAHEFAEAALDGILSRFMPESARARAHAEIVREMMMAGGTREGLFATSHEGFAQAVADVRNNVRPWSRFASNPLRIIPEIGKLLEETTRTAVFRQKLRETGDARLAARFMRDASADFGRGGDWAKVVNKVIPFFNASIQGTKSTLDAIRLRPYETARGMVASAMFPTVVLYAHNSKYASYQDVPQWERDKYWIVMVSEEDGTDINGNPKKIPNYIKVPKGVPQQVLGSVMERALNKGQSQYPESTLQFLQSIAGDLSPVSTTSWIPTSFQIPIELMTNHSFFRGKAIEPDFVLARDGVWRKSSEVLPKDRTAYDTSTVAKMLGEGLGWSPAKIDYVIKTGAMNDFIRTLDGFLPKEANANPERPQTTFEKLTQKPLLRSVFGSSSYGQDIQRKAAESLATQQANSAEIADPFALRAKAYMDGTATPTEKARFEQLLTDPTMRKKYREFRSEARLGITRAEKSLLGKGVANGERAGIIFNNEKNMDPAQVPDYLARLRRQKVLTKDVMRQLRKLEAGQ